jgi:hypothetical protein
MASKKSKELSFFVNFFANTGNNNSFTNKKIFLEQIFITFVTQL